MFRSVFSNTVAIISSLALIIAFFLPIAPLAALAATTPDGLVYQEDNFRIKITGYTGGGGKVVIPEKINGKSVNELGYSSFKQQRGITEVVIPNTVTVIGAYAFSECTGMIKINIPDSVTSIGARAFASCHALGNFNFGINVRYIGDNAFWNCSTLTTVVLPPQLERVYEDTFYWCENLISVTIPAGVGVVELGAFAGCPNLKDAYFLGDAPALRAQSFEFGWPPPPLKTTLHFFQHSTGYDLGTWSPTGDPYEFYNTIWMDYDGAVLHAGTATRTSDTTATITFTSDKPGWAFYEAVADGAAPPNIWCGGHGIESIAGTNALSITNITAGAKDVYVRFKDIDGKHSTQLKYDLPATPKLGDAILGLQVIAGVAPTEQTPIGFDIDGNGKLGMEEVIYLLQKLAGIR